MRKLLYLDKINILSSLIFALVEIGWRSYLWLPFIPLIVSSIYPFQVIWSNLEMSFTSKCHQYIYSEFINKMQSTCNTKLP